MQGAVSSRAAQITAIRSGQTARLVGCLEMQQGAEAAGGSQEPSGRRPRLGGGWEAPARPLADFPMKYAVCSMQYAVCSMQYAV